MRARICSAFSCDMFARVVVWDFGERKTTDFCFATVPHALATHYFLRLTRARRTEVRKEDGASPPCWLLVLLVMQKYDKHKEFSILFYKRHLIRRGKPRHLLPLEKALYPLFLLTKQAQKKKLSKRKRRGRTFALCGARQELRALDCAAFWKRRAKTLVGRQKLWLCAKTLIVRENFGYGRS